VDSLIAAASRALAAGDALGALKRVALRDDPPALALRGIAMPSSASTRGRRAAAASRARLRRHEEMARARCVVAEAEVALAMRDLGGSPRALASAAAALDARADHANALQARLIAARRLLLLGRLDETAAALAPLLSSLAPLLSSLAPLLSPLAPLVSSVAPPASSLAPVDVRGLPPSLAAVAELTSAELALRSLRIIPARAALARAHQAAERAQVPALQAEVEEARAALQRPAARRLAAGTGQTLRLDEVAALLASDTLVLDSCRRGLRAGGAWLSLARRPVLFALARASPRRAGRRRAQTLIAQAFAPAIPTRRIAAASRSAAAPDRCPARRHRGHGRLRARPHPSGVAVLVPPIDGDEASLLALLADGAAWSTRRRAGPRRKPAQAARARRARGRRPGARHAGRSAGWRRRSPVSRRSCYSPLRCRSTRLASPRRPAHT
jgi:hypothetical protein